MHGYINPLLTSQNASVDKTQMLLVDIVRYTHDVAKHFTMYSATDQEVSNQFVCMSVSEYIIVGPRAPFTQIVVLFTLS